MKILLRTFLLKSFYIRSSNVLPKSISVNFHLISFNLLPFSSTGVLINEILSNMLRKADPQRNSQSRLSLYSARDLALVYLWRGLKIKPEITERPSYGAALIIELHEISDKYRVKVYFNEPLR